MMKPFLVCICGKLKENNNQPVYKHNIKYVETSIIVTIDCVGTMFTLDYVTMITINCGTVITIDCGTVITIGSVIIITIDYVTINTIL